MPRSQRIRALADIRKAQKSTHLLMRTAPLLRVVRVIVANGFEKGVTLQSNALIVLQEGLEALLISALENANLATIHRSCVTVGGNDFRLVRRIKCQNAPDRHREVWCGPNI